MFGCIAATNADLEQRFTEGKFREDLYYRLSVIRIHIPPLRQRREEIPHLSTLFLREVGERLGKRDVQLSSDVMQLFAHYHWPGNIRQLRNEVQRAVALAPPGGTVGPEHLSSDMTIPEAPSQPAANGGKPVLSDGQSLANHVDDVERSIIADTMMKFSGNISESARILGLTRRGLYLKLRRFGLESGGVPDTK